MFCGWLSARHDTKSRNRSRSIVQKSNHKSHKITYDDRLIYSDHSLKEIIAWLGNALRLNVVDHSCYLFYNHSQKCSTLYFSICRAHFHITDKCSSKCCRSRPTQQRVHFLPKLFTLGDFVLLNHFLVVLYAFKNFSEEPRWIVDDYPHNLAPKLKTKLARLIFGKGYESYKILIRLYLTDLFDQGICLFM